MAATKLNQLKQAKLDAEKALNTLLSEQDAARDAYSTLVAKQVAETLTDEDKAKLPEAKRKLDGFAARISGQRELVQMAKEAQLAEEQRIETAATASAGSGLETEVEVVEDQAAKWAKDPKRGFASHREFFGAVMAAGDGQLDPRLKAITVQKRQGPQAAAGSDEQGVYSDPYGGFLVPSGVAPGILQVEAEGDPLAPLVTNIPMQTSVVKFNARVDKDHSSSVSGGLTVSRRAETVDGTSSRMKFEQVVLSANEEFGLAYATEAVLADSPQSFIAMLTAGFQDEYVAFAMNERINGSGTGERMGLLNSPALISITKENSQVAATIVKANIDKMTARSWRYGRAVWLANHNTRPQLASLHQVVGTGGALVPYFVTSGSQETLNGRPIYFTEFAKTLGTAGDLILVVPSEYLEGMYQSTQFAESIHVRFVSAERAFRFYRRTDGRPWWTTALTPKNGDTLSPIVTLATRA